MAKIKTKLQLRLSKEIDIYAVLKDGKYTAMFFKTKEQAQNKIKSITKDWTVLDKVLGPKYTYKKIKGSKSLL